VQRAEGVANLVRHRQAGDELGHPRLKVVDRDDAAVQALVHALDAGSLLAQAADTAVIGRGPGQTQSTWRE